jgi:hypothetical protein
MNNIRFKRHLWAGMLAGSYSCFLWRSPDDIQVDSPALKLKEAFWGHALCSRRECFQPLNFAGSSMTNPTNYSGAEVEQ